MKKALDTVLSHFRKLAQIPRPSHHEELVSDYLYQWAEAQELMATRDSLGDVIIDKPASAGFEKSPRVILQAHMDMVCVAEDGISYNPLNDSIRVQSDGEYLTAEGTSLGADNGIGIALCLYLLEDTSLCHGPLRAIFTVNEEDGMTSAAIDPSYLAGSYLINLDWETGGSLCNSCAGGDYFCFYRETDWKPVPAGSRKLCINLSGLLGGHSGLAINLGRANALASVATLLSKLRCSGILFQIAAFRGGLAKNAIPDYACAELVISADDVTKAENVITQFCREFYNAYGNIEQEAVLETVFSEQLPERVLSRELSESFAGILACVPNNVHTMSPLVDGLVESSANLGVSIINQDQVSFTVFTRSSVPYQASQLGTICALLARKFNFDFECQGHIPGWPVNPNSNLRDITCATYEELTGEVMVVEPVHGGLECGAFAEKNPDLDMISIGPTLLDVHTTKERCRIADIEIMAELLVSALMKLAG